MSVAQNEASNGISSAPELVSSEPSTLGVGVQKNMNSAGESVLRTLQVASSRSNAGGRPVVEKEGGQAKVKVPNNSSDVMPRKRRGRPCKIKDLVGNNSMSDVEDPDWRPSTTQKSRANASTSRSTRSAEKESDATSEPTKSGGPNMTRRMSTSKEPDHVQWIKPGGDDHGHGRSIVYGAPTYTVGTKPIEEDGLSGQTTHERVHKRRKLAATQATVEHTPDVGSSGFQVEAPPVAEDIHVTVPDIAVILARQGWDVVEVPAPATDEFNAKDMRLSAWAAESVRKAGVLQNRVDRWIKENGEERGREAAKLAQALEDLEAEKIVRIAAEARAATAARRLNKEVGRRRAAEDGEKLALARCVALDACRNVSGEAEMRAAAEDREKLAVDRCAALEGKIAVESQAAKAAAIDAGRKLSEEVERRAAAVAGEKVALDRCVSLEGRLVAEGRAITDAIDAVKELNEEVEKRMAAEGREHVALDRCIVLEGRIASLEAQEVATAKTLTQEFEKNLSAEDREKVALDRCVALESRIVVLESEEADLRSSEALATKTLSEEAEKRVAAEDREKVALASCVSLEKKISVFEAQEADYLSREALATKTLSEEVEKKISAEDREKVALDRWITLESRIVVLESEESDLRSSEALTTKTLTEEIEKRVSAEDREAAALERIAIEGRIALESRTAIESEAKTAGINAAKRLNEEIEKRISAEDRAHVALERCVTLEAHKTDYISREAVAAKRLDEVENTKKGALDRCAELEERIAELESQRTGFLSKDVVVKQEIM